MPDLTYQYLPAINQGRLANLDFGNAFIHPSYDGWSILNIPASICRWLGVPESASPALAPEIMGTFNRRYRRVILVLVDALALHRLQRWMADGTAGVWKDLTQAGSLFPLTSLVPSTTSAALLSLWTGRSPAEHGIVGYEMWMKEYGVVANTILHSVITFQNDNGSLERAGFKPEEYLAYPALGRLLSNYGVQVASFQHAGILRSGLSRMYQKDVKFQGFQTAADLWVNVRRYLESQPQETAYIYVYWPEVDTLSHHYGPDDERTAAEFSSFSAAFERLFLERLGRDARQDTLLLLVADHGMISSNPDPHYDLRHHPGLARRLHIRPTGEHRLAYLFVRPGQTEAVREYMERAWPDQFTIVDSAFAAEAGLFGPGRPHPALLDRLGDLIVIARGEAYLWWADKENHLYGRHGGMSADEMLVPLLVAPL